MCYDVSYLTKKLERYAKHYGSDEDWQDIKKRLPPTYHTQGFDHPDIPVVVGEAPDRVDTYTWGLIPKWVKDAASATKISNSTLNARSEEMFEKPSYKGPAKSKHCLVIIDGFFEHHWKNGKSYPYFIQLKNNEPFALAGLWEEWQGKRTVTIVTTRANPLMQKIHNKPRGSEGPRMPLIIPREMESEWLKSVADDIDKEKLMDWIGPYDENEMESYTVPRLRGKAYQGNVPDITKRVQYDELDSSQGKLF
ncbi:SOS response-associated peptidase [Fulvivirga sp. RKSG066]|uniref:SOS response-associated peptidase n=1 Tax=Fulvivirga aurantia TaxID=2529383 RepID=UPI0012BB6C83|nr:SOS response-associated peptidase [Fulvivirga aurantia]MTI22022.1 SOS response-associated peptidase [Fulvivirga aurantia]